MSTSASKDPSYFKNKMTDEDIKKILKIFEQLEKDPQAYDFLEPVDYIKLGIPTYPEIIKTPMDLGTVKKNLQENEYETFSNLLADINLIWTNCRTFNLPGSEIVKMANHCEKSFRKLFDKQFKNYGNKLENKNIANPLSQQEKVELTEKIRCLSNEELTQTVKLIMKECSKAVEEIDNEKIQIKVDLIDHKTYESLLNLMKKPEKNDSENKSAKKDEGSN